MSYSQLRRYRADRLRAPVAKIGSFHAAGALEQTGGRYPYEDAADRMFAASGANYAVVQIGKNGQSPTLQQFSTGTEARGAFDALSRGSSSFQALYDKVTYPDMSPRIDERDFSNEPDVFTVTNVVERVKDAAPFIIAAGVLIAGAIYFSKPGRAPGRRRKRPAYRRVVSVWR